MDIHGKTEYYCGYVGQQGNVVNITVDFTRVRIYATQFRNRLAVEPVIAALKDHFKQATIEIEEV